MNHEKQIPQFISDVAYIANRRADCAPSEDVGGPYCDNCGTGRHKPGDCTPGCGCLCSAPRCAACGSPQVEPGERLCEGCALVEDAEDALAEAEDRAYEAGKWPDGGGEN